MLRTLSITTLLLALTVSINAHAEGDGSMTSLTCKAMSTAGAEIELNEQLSKGLIIFQESFSDSSGHEGIEVGSMKIAKTLSLGYNTSVGQLIIKITPTSIIGTIETYDRVTSKAEIAATGKIAKDHDAAYEGLSFKLVTKDVKVKCQLTTSGWG